MAVSDVQREGQNESQLRKERLASARSETGSEPQYGPGPIDVDSGIRNDPFVGRAAQRLHDRGIVNIPDMPSQFLDQEAAQSRRTAMEEERARDRASLKSAFGGGRGRDQQQDMANQLNRSRRQDRKGGKEEGGAPSLRDAVALAKGNPLAALGMGAAQGGASALAGQGLPIADIQRGIGRGCILMLWNGLWLSFGHSIYIISILFFIAWASQYARKYFPEVGEEWFPSQLLKRIPKVALIPIKLAEILAISFILFWVLLMDLACVGIIALIIAVVISAVNLVS